MDQQLNQISLDVLLVQYKAAKAKGAVRILDIDGQVYYTQKGFDPHTGEQKPIHIPIILSDLQKMAEGMAEKQSLLDQLITDVENSLKV